MSARPKVTAVSIVMPTYNEAGNISDLIRDCAAAVRRANITTVELIVVDDDSPDGTWKLAQETECPGATVRVIRRTTDPGLTASLREGIAAARHDVVVWLDCDYSHPPEKITQMLFMLDQGFDIVVNSRYAVGGGEDRVGKGGPLQQLLSGALNWGIRFLLHPAFSDYTSGFVAVRREVVTQLGLRGDYGEYFVDFAYRAIRQHYSICELPYTAPPRRWGESKTGSNLFDYLRRGRKYVATVARLRLGGRIEAARDSAGSR